jgi:hypothetical protein
VDDISNDHTGERMKPLKSIQDIFKGDFVNAMSAVMQRVHRTDYNVGAVHRNFTERWPALREPFDLVAVSIPEQAGYPKRREIWVGFLEDTTLVQQDNIGSFYRFRADRFQLLGIHDLDQVSDAEFYGNGGGGGSRVIVYKSGLGKGSPSHRGTTTPTPEGVMVQRLIWVRKNHGKFRDPVQQHWEGKCAVSDHDCNGLLIASHIFPWARSTSKEKTDVNNGLLLSAPLDKLFDQGLIAFANDGTMLVSKNLSKRTQRVFGLKAAGGEIADTSKVTRSMLQYLARHRRLHGFPD